MQNTYTVQRAIKRGGKIHEAGAVMTLSSEDAARLVEIGALELVGPVEQDKADAAFNKVAAEQAVLEKAAEDQAKADKEAQAAADKAAAAQAEADKVAAKAAPKTKGKK